MANGAILEESQQLAWDCPYPETDQPRLAARSPYSSREKVMPLFVTRKRPSPLAEMPQGGNSREVSRELICRSRKLLDQSRRRILNTRNSLVYHHTHAARRN
jgi:hypothetical protein